MCNLSHATEVLHRIHISLSSSYRTLKRFIIAICTSLPRQLLRPKNAWYFYTDIVTHYFVTLFSNTQARQFFFTFKFLLKHRYLTAAKFKDLAKFVSFAEIFFYYSFQIHCSYLLSKILRVLVQAKRWVACRCLIKLRVHSLEIKELISIICSEENNLTSFVLSLFLLNLSQALSSDCWVFRFIFRGKSDL